MKFKILGEITNQEIIEVGNRIREISILKKKYGKARWRKLKGITQIKLEDHSIFKVEIHWYEAHGIGKKEYKIKRFLD